MKTVTKDYLEKIVGVLNLNERNTIENRISFYTYGA